MSTPYTEAVLDFRRRKDEHFASGRGPVAPEGFHGLSYFAPDPHWSFRAVLERAPSPEAARFTLETNTGEPRVMDRYGTLTLPLPGGPHTLSVFVPAGEDRPQRVFIPFRDATSGQQTYGAGRYLDAPVSAQSEGGDLLIEVDFNMAYQPYCAYGDGWTCPLPPGDNWIAQPIPAGERLSGQD